MIQQLLTFFRTGNHAQADISMRRVKTVEVSGHVMDRNGPVKEALVSLEQSHFGIGRQDTTDEKGSFRLEGVPPGSYVLVVYQRREREEVYEPGARQKVEVNGDNIDSLTISLGLGVDWRVLSATTMVL